MSLKARVLAALALFPICFSLFAHGQSAPPWEASHFEADPKAILAASAAIPANPKFSSTVLFEEKRYDITGSGLVHWVSFRVLRADSADGVESIASFSTDWAPWEEEQPKLRARVITSDGSIHLLDPKTLTDRPARDDSTDVYSDERVYGGPLPAVAAGCVIEEEIITNAKIPLFDGGHSGRFFFGDSVPVHHTHLTITVPSDVPLKYKLALLPDLKTSKHEQDGKTEYTFEEGLRTPPEEDVDALPPDVDKYPSINFSTDKSWADIASRYSSIVDAKLAGQDLGALTKDANKSGDRLQTVAALVARLHSKVRYTGVEFGESSLIPQPPSETLRRGYGDCKDKATLLVGMLRASGIDARVAILSAGPGRDVDPEIPGIGLFDHAIVYVPGSPELWIDATADFTSVPNVPEGDQGRYALVISSDTSELKKIPIAPFTDNVARETREFFLAEYGPSRVIETTGNTGAFDDAFRSSYGDKQSPDEKEQLKGYAKDVYLSEEVEKVEHNSGSDLTKAFYLRLTFDKASRGYTSLSEADVYVPLGGLVSRLPKYFRDGEPEKDEKNPAKKPRTADYQLIPFVSEWNYVIHVPVGFRVRLLPEDGKRMMGTASLSTHCNPESDDLVHCTFRFESPRSRLTATEAQELRHAVHELQDSKVPNIGLDMKANVFLQAGQVREALQEYRRLVALHPKEAIHHVQLASALLEAGVGDGARAEIKRAIELDPKSVIAYQIQGWVLQHDLIGRRFEKGFDYDGAVAAYRKAKQLDPDEGIVRVNLAILMEHDATGRRYSPNSKLDAAVYEFRDLRGVNAAMARQYEDNVLYDLFYAGRFDDLLEQLGKSAASSVHTSLRLACIGAQHGSAQALKSAESVSAESKERSNAMIGAGDLLLRIRKYLEAADLYAAAAPQGDNASALSQRAEIYRKTRIYKEAASGDLDPTVEASRFFVLLMGSKDVDESLFTMFSNPPSDAKERSLLIRKTQALCNGLRSRFRSVNLPPDVLLDLMMSNMNIAKEGDDKVGYRLVLHMLGGSNMTFFVDDKDHKFLIVGIGSEMEDAGIVVRRKLQVGDLDGARRWLDWARAELKGSTGEDPLSGHPLTYFWTRGDPADPEKMKIAAAALAVPTSSGDEDVHVEDDNSKRTEQILLEARTNATDAIRPLVNRALAQFYVRFRDWKRLSPIAEELVKQYPQSATAFFYLFHADLYTQNFSAAEQVINDRLKRLPDDESCLRAYATLEEARGNFEKARAYGKQLIDHGRASSSDRNRYAWEALFTGKVSPEDVDVARQANDETKNNNWQIMHTLACLYAEVGKGKEARDLLVKVIEEQYLGEPNSPVWYGYGRIYEGYGENAAATAAYGRIENNSIEGPTSTYRLMQLRRKIMEAQPTASAR